jgi:cobalt-zinc-cadmium efflux system outer membrane protein
MRPILLIALLAFPTWAQRLSQTILDPGGRTAAEVVALALDRNGDILAGRQQVTAAMGGVTQARLKANPSLDASGAHQLTGSMNTITAGVSLPLELHHRRERRTEVAETSAKASDLEQADRERRLRGEVEAKFGDVLASLRDLQVTEDLLDLNRKALELTQARADQGAIPPLDTNLLRVEVNRIDALRVSLEAKVEVDLLELKSLAGMKPEEQLLLQGSLDTPPHFEERPVQTRPDLLAAQQAQLVADARLRQTQTDARADANVFASYQRVNSSFDLNAFNPAGQIRPIQGIFHFLSAGVSITLPVRNRNQGAIETAVAQIEEATHRREYLELVAMREVASARISLEKAREALRIYRDGVRTQASENLQVVRRAYELGRTQLLDVIAEQRRYMDVEMGYTEALARVYQASVRMRTVLGAGQ